MYTSMENTITMTMKSMSTIMITKSTNITMATTMTNVAADTITIMKNMSIITATTMTNVAVDTIMTMNIITIMNAAVDMTTMLITIIMQMRYSQAGAVRQLRNTPEKIWRRNWKLFLLLRIMVSSFVPRVCFLQKTEHGSTLTWFRKKQRSVKVHRNIQAVCA